MIFERPFVLPDFGQFGKRLLKIGNDPVEKYMVKKVIAFDENDSDFQVAMMMMKSNLKRAPILSDGIFVGMVSRADLLDHILRSAKEEVDSNFYK